MADRSITIEGSLTPSTDLPRGERRRVQRTEHVDMLIREGRVIVIDDETGAVEGAPLSPYTDNDPPPRNASRADWAEFIASRTGATAAALPATEGLTRDQLVAAWDDAADGGAPVDYPDPQPGNAADVAPDQPEK